MICGGQRDRTHREWRGTPDAGEESENQHLCWRLCETACQIKGRKDGGPYKQDAHPPEIFAEGAPYEAPKVVRDLKHREDHEFLDLTIHTQLFCNDRQSRRNDRRLNVCEETENGH
jgi:hypothetical protein